MYFPGELSALMSILTSISISPYELRTVWTAVASVASFKLGVSRAELASRELCNMRYRGQFDRISFWDASRFCKSSDLRDPTLPEAGSCLNRSVSGKCSARTPRTGPQD